MYLVRQGVFPLFRALPFNPSFTALSQRHPFYNPSLSRLLLLLFFFYFSHLFLRFSLQVSLLSSAALCYFFLISLSICPQVSLNPSSTLLSLPLPPCRFLFLAQFRRLLHSFLSNHCFFPPPSVSLLVVCLYPPPPTPHFLSLPLCHFIPVIRLLLRSALLRAYLCVYLRVRVIGCAPKLHKSGILRKLKRDLTVLMENEEHAGAEKQILSITSVSMCRRQGPRTRQQYKEHVRERRGTVSCGGFGHKVPPPPYGRYICVCRHSCTHRSGKHAPCRLRYKCASAHLRMCASCDTKTDATTHAQSGL